MNARAIKWTKQGEINPIQNSTMWISPLTSYEWESNRVEQSGRDEHNAIFPNYNQTTHFLCIREQQVGTDRQWSVPFWIPNDNHITYFLWMTAQTHVRACQQTTKMFLHLYLCIWTNGWGTGVCNSGIDGWSSSQGFLWSYTQFRCRCWPEVAEFAYN